MAQDLNSYEQLVASLVQEIERYGNARASVDNARHELIQLQARVEAVGKQAEETARLSAQLLAEIRRLTPEDLTSPILEALTSEATAATGRHNEVRDLIAHVEQRTTEARAAEDARAASRHQGLLGPLSRLEQSATEVKSTHSVIAADITASSVNLARLTRVIYASIALNVIVILILLLR